MRYHALMLRQKPKQSQYIINSKQERAILMNEKRNRDLIKWQRYGHLNVSDLKNMKNNDIVLGMKFAS